MKEIVLVQILGMVEVVLVGFLILSYINSKHNRLQEANNAISTRLSHKIQYTVKQMKCPHDCVEVVDLSFQRREYPRIRPEINFRCLSCKYDTWVNIKDVNPAQKKALIFAGLVEDKKGTNNATDMSKA